jgi:protein-L-isoaspartate(D-aspartate) O-methyltransferase
MDELPSLELLRRRMVEEQIFRGGIRSQPVLAAMRKVPRHRFVLPEYQHQAYDDRPLPIGYGQTISQPFVVGLMTQLLRVKPSDRVLEIGTGSGYQAAILGELAGEVHTIERHAALAQHAAGILAELGIDNVSFHVGDGSLGLAEYAPFDAILVTAGAPSVPEMLLEQLSERGRLVIPVGKWTGQSLERWRRTPTGFEHEALAPVAFVPLVGKAGWESGEEENENAPV